MTLHLVLTADSDRGSTELDAWWRAEKAFAVGFPGPRHFFWIHGLDNNICRLLQKHRLSAQAPEQGSGEDIWLAGWLVTRMSRPHVICSITIYDPLILNHTKSHLRPRPGYILLCLLWTQPLESSRSTPTTCPCPLTAGIREDGLTHLVSKGFCTFLGWLPAASAGYRCEVISRL